MLNQVFNNLSITCGVKLQTPLDPVTKRSDKLVLAEPVSPMLGKNEARAAPMLAFAGWQHVLRRKGRSISIPEDKMVKG